MIKLFHGPEFSDLPRAFPRYVVLQICEYVSPKIRTDCFSNNINSLRSLLHIYSVKEVTSLKVSFSNFSCMFLNPDNFFQFEF